MVLIDVDPQERWTPTQSRCDNARLHVTVDSVSEPPEHPPMVGSIYIADNTLWSVLADGTFAFLLYLFTYIPRVIIHP
jgi:hypothetical protein